MDKYLKGVLGTVKPGDIFSDMFAFKKRLAQPLILLVYWAGLCILGIIFMGFVGAAYALAKNDWPMGVFAGIPVFVGGILLVLSGMVMWRAFCEFYVTILRIADDLTVLRQSAEGQETGPGAEYQTQTHAQPMAPVYAQSVAQNHDPYSTRVPGHAPLFSESPDSESAAERDPLNDPFYRRIKGVGEP